MRTAILLSAILIGTAIAPEYSLPDRSSSFIAWVLIAFFIADAFELFMLTTRG